MSQPTQQIADEWLVLRSQDGDAGAFEQLVSRWQERLWRHARRLVRDDASAWDVLQEAWMSMLKGLRKLDDPAAFAPWAYRVVTLRCVDHVRRRQRQRKVERALPAPSAVEVPGEGDDVEALRLALDELSVEQRALLSLHYREGLRLERIGEILGVPVGTVKSRLHHARAALKKKIERRRT
jgi:RNA polymerase sigma-70 factor (ECF subfamily)